MPHLALSDEDQVAFARACRRSCSECGSAAIVWGDVAAGALVARTDAQRACFVEGMVAALAGDWPAWWCEDCDGMGAFFPAESLF